MENTSETMNRFPVEIKIQAFELLALIITIVSVFLWCRSDAKDDYRQMQQRTEALIDAIRQESHAEMKDFHGRLCAIEERNKTTRTE